MHFSRRQWLGLGAAGLAYPFLPRVATGHTSSPVRLHSNENPYAPSDSARRAMMSAHDEGNLYPSAHYHALDALIAEREGLTPDHVVLGAGSTEVLRMAAMAYGLEGGEILTAYPTYEGLDSYAVTINAHVHRVPLDPDLLIDLGAMEQRTTQSVRLVYVCNPNNPTGTLCHKAELADFCATVSRRSIVLVDEAYYELVDSSDFASMVPMVRRGANVIVSRTFSKVFGLAGLRIGYALARPDLAARLRRYRTANSINIIALRAAIASYADLPFVEFSRSRIAAERTSVTRMLRQNDHRVVDSHANFVFFHLGRPVADFQAAMETQGVLVGRPFPPYLDWCRLSIGTADEMAQFVNAYYHVMRA